MNAWLVWAIALAALVALNLVAARIARRMGGRTRPARRHRRTLGGGPARPTVDELLARCTWEWRLDRDHQPTEETP